MAYDASNNKNDENQVTSSNPLSSGSQPQSQPVQGDSQASQAPSQPSTVQSGMSSTQAGAAQQPQQSKKPASSGMFTNIQKYVSKNKPQAQKMAGAVTENVGSQASEIAQQAEKKQADMNASLQANQQAMDAQKKEAEQMVGNIMGTNQPAPVQQPAQQNYGQPIGNIGEVDPGYKAPNIQEKVVTGTVDGGQPSIEQTPEQIEASQARFQELMGGATGLIDVGNINLAEQSQKARALQQMAGQAGTEMGRRNLLQDTFKKQGEYTQGMGGLDQLVVSGSDQARQQLSKGVQDQANNLQQNIQDIGIDTNKQKMAQDRLKQQFGTDIRALAENPLTTLESDLDQKVLDEKAARGEYTPVIQRYEKGLSDRYNALKDIYGSFSKASRAGQVDFTDLMKSGNLGVPVDVYMDYYGLDGNYNNYSDLVNSAKLTSDDLGRLGIDASKIADQFTQESGLGLGGNRTDHSYAIGDIYNALNNYETSPIENILREKGYNLDQFSDMSDITSQNVASEEEFNRFNKLKGLLGQSTSPEDRKSIVSSSDLEEILKEQGIFPGDVKTGGTGSGGGSRS